MRRLRSLAVVSALVFTGLGGCAQKNLTDTSAALNYQDYGRMVDVRVVSPRGIESIEVVDARPEDARAGFRIAETDGSTGDIAFTGDIDAWVRDGAKHVLSSAGVGVGDGPITMTVELESLTLNEKVFRNATYDSRVAITVRLSGAADWSGSASGAAKNYGSSAKQENYAETFNHALYKALADIAARPDFRDALRGN